MAYLPGYTPRLQAQQASGTWVVEHPRPVVAALGLLEQRTGRIYTYEDPPMEFDGDIEDYTVVDKGDGKRALGPRRARLEIAGELASMHAAVDPLPAVQAVLDADARLAGEPGRFRVTRSGDVVQVVGVRYRDRLGVWRTTVPALDVPITLPPSTEVLPTFLDLFCAAVEYASGAVVKPGTYPVNSIRGPTFSVTAVNEPARSVLLRVLESTGHRLTWHSYFDPSTKAWYLNITLPGVTAPKAPQ